MVFGEGAFGKWPGPENVTFGNCFSDVIKEAEQRLTILLSIWAHKKVFFLCRNRLSWDTDCAGALNFPNPRTMRKTCLFYMLSILRNFTVNCWNGPKSSSHTIYLDAFDLKSLQYSVCFPGKSIVIWILGLRWLPGQQEALFFLHWGLSVSRASPRHVGWLPPVWVTQEYKAETMIPSMTKPQMPHAFISSASY